MGGRAWKGKRRKGGWLGSAQNDFNWIERGADFPSVRKSSRSSLRRSGKSVRSSAATSPLLPRARRTRATVMNWGAKDRLRSFMREERAFRMTQKRHDWPGFGGRTQAK